MLFVLLYVESIKAIRLMVPGNKFVVVSMGLCRGYGGGEKWVMGLKDAKKVKEISQLIAKTFSCMALRKIPRKKWKLPHMPTSHVTIASSVQGKPANLPSNRQYQVIAGHRKRRQAVISTWLRRQKLKKQRLTPSDAQPERLKTPTNGLQLSFLQKKQIKIVPIMSVGRMFAVLMANQGSIRSIP